MKPFDDTRSIFVHVPKCAGVSVCRALYGNLAGGHTTLDEYLGIFEPRCIERYFKFSVVRNPWDRLVSAYHFLQAGGFSDTDKRWFDREIGMYANFEDFVVNWVNPTNIRTYHHFAPQHHYLFDKHCKVRLDFIALLENLTDDFVTIARQFDHDRPRVLGKVNTANHRSYTDYYNDKTRQIVAEAYAQDIALLGYSFDNSSLRKQLETRARQNGSLLQN